MIGVPVYILMLPNDMPAPGLSAWVQGLHNEETTCKSEEFTLL